MKFTNGLAIASLMLLATLVGCGGDSGGGTAGGGGAAEPGDVGDGPSVGTFSLAWSEYPSWSVFGVAHEMDLINGEEGELGSIEQKYKVDIVLKEAGYDSCLNMFTSSNCDAVCMTNMDALIVCPGREGAAILPTSTSNGADACIVAGVESVEDLKGVETFGLKGTVSEYAFFRCLEELGQKPEEFKFTNQDPGAAAVAMTQKQDTHKAIMVWNPFVLQTLKDRPDSKVLFDSSKIPGEIVDMVVVGQDVLKKEGGEAFAHAVIETFYTMNQRLDDPSGGEQVLVELGRKFSNLDVNEMKTVVKQTQFYKTADDAITLLSGDEFKATMQTVEKFCVGQKLVEEPSYGYAGETGKKLVFDGSLIQAWKDKQ